MIEAFRAAALAAERRPEFAHVHGPVCTFEVCGVGISRAELVRATLLRKLSRREEFLHYKRVEVEAMRKLG